MGIMTFYLFCFFSFQNIISFLIFLSLLQHFHFPVQLLSVARLFFPRVRKKHRRAEAEKTFYFSFFLVFPPLLLISFHKFPLLFRTTVGTTTQQQRGERWGREKKKWKKSIQIFQMFHRSFAYYPAFSRNDFRLLCMRFSLWWVEGYALFSEKKKINWNELKLRPCGRHLCPHKLRILHTCHMKLW